MKHAHKGFHLRPSGKAVKSIARPLNLRVAFAIARAEDRLGVAPLEVIRTKVVSDRRDAAKMASKEAAVAICGSPASQPLNIS